MVVGPMFIYGGKEAPGHWMEGCTLRQAICTVRFFFFFCGLCVTVPARSSVIFNFYFLCVVWD